MSQHIIVWRRYQGRVDAMAPHFGMVNHYLGFVVPYRALRPLEYLAKAPKTVWILLRHRPSVLWVQLPPTPLLYLAALYRLVARRTRLVADCHNSIVWAPWRHTPLLRTMLNRVVDVVLAHNHDIRQELLVLGVRPDRCVVLEDRPATAAPDGHDLEAAKIGAPRPWVLFPASYDGDEPINALLEAARRLPDVTFVLTGDPRRADGRHDLESAPDNVIFTGWVPATTYKSLLAHADLVVGLTLLDNIQLSGANEAVGHGKAMVLSDTPLLRRLFPEGAIYAAPEASALAQAIREALERQPELEAGIRRLQAQRDERWLEQASEVERHLGAPSDRRRDA